VISSFRVFVILLLVAAGVAWWYCARSDSTARQPFSAVEQSESVGLETPPAIPVRADSLLPYNPDQFNLTIDQSIQVFEDRVRDDPRNHLNLTTLGGLYIRKAREDGDLAAYDKAESSFQRALKVVPTHAPTRLGLAVSASARHDFARSLDIAQAVLHEAPDDPAAKSITADALLELGRYDEATRAIRDLERQGPQPPPPAVLSRLARIAELRGDTDAAVRLLSQALEVQRGAHDFKQSAAWYSMRLGEIQFAQGRFDDAARALDSALADHPNYGAAMTILARVRVAQGRILDAISLLEKAITLHPDLSTLADLGDLYAQTGQDFRARVLFDSIEKTAGDKPEYDREVAMFWCNHDRELPKALERAKRDLERRRDIFAYDALAWALFKNDRAAEAAEAIQSALKLGTKDATLFFHAGAIYEKLGDKAKARDFLRRALALNPHFSINQADLARRLLAGIE
jgi:tetratricopeptide (TPR) repeat protein